MTVDLKLESVIIPVSDVDGSRQFYEHMGWRLDADLDADGLRIVQLTPPGSPCSVQFGAGLTDAEPGSAQNLLVVSDIEAAQSALTALGVAVTEVFHDGGGGYDRWRTDVRAGGPDPDRRTYASFAEFRDPDGNLWQIQEVTSRLSGRVDPTTSTFSSVNDLAAALRRAAHAHGVHESRTGVADENWPDWYASYMVAEATGGPLPT